MSLVLTTAEMRSADQAATERLGVPALVLMENAGRAVAEAVARRRPNLAGLKVSIVCGSGQNGGDGFVVARHLANRGAAVRVLLAFPRSKISAAPAGQTPSAPAVYLAAAERTPGVRIEDHGALTDEQSWAAELAGAEIIVDAVFGTGLRSEVKGVPAAAIAGMNAAPAALRVAVDIPSGLDADSGQSRGAVVKADVTVTMGALKPGLVLDATAPVGELIVADLGVAMTAVIGSAPRCQYVDDDLARGLVRRQSATGHKGSRGHALLIAGSVGKTGAALLCARGAFRAGAGMVTVASTEAGQRALDAKVVEAMTACYTAGDDADDQSVGQVMELVRAKGMKAAAIGPGIPTGPGSQSLVHRLARDLALPLVLDADALNLLGKQAPDILRWAGAPRIVTPHPGEMSRLVGRSTAEIQADRLGVARQLAAASGAVVVLKGARTVIALPDGRSFINPAADPSLGTAGSGDVLTGVLAGLLAQGLAAEDAAVLGVHVHGLAGQEASRGLGARHILAGELPDAVARVLEGYLGERQL